MNPKKFFSKTDIQLIENAIENAEKLSSGEIRLHIQSITKEADVLLAAKSVFEKLNMHETALRNGVLFYLSIDDHQFAVIGDKGINEVVPANFWDTICQQIIEFFKNGQYTDGLMWAIEQAGKQLAIYFPIQKDDTNELSNEISFETKNE